MTARHSLNRMFDALPRTRLGCFGSEVPAFRACGVAGFYLALIVLGGAGVMTRRSLPVLALMAAASAASFYAYTYLRRWIAGGESLVLLESVWFALACNTALLWLLGEPRLPYLDILCLALCPFLTCGRIGCTLVGCCHGRPSSLGIAYGEDCARDGFARHLVGVRLFPVPTIEAAGLLAIGATGLLALPFARPGEILAWYLIAYATMRFGLEGIRGDRRPHLWGLSQARWMSLAEAAFAFHLMDGRPHPKTWLEYGVLALVLIAALILRRLTDWRRRLLADAHVAELRAMAQAGLDGGPRTLETRATSQRVTVVISPAGRPWQGAVHASVSLPESRHDLSLLCDLTAQAFPGLVCGAAEFTDGRVLHVLVQRGKPATPDLRDALYGCVVRRLQHRSRESEPAVPPSPVADHRASKGDRHWYFSSRGIRAGNQ